MFLASYLEILSASKQMQRQEKDLQRQSEETAEQGNVDASMNFANQAEALSKQQAELYKQFTTPERTMSVCDVCGVFINSTDSDQRKAVRPRHLLLKTKTFRVLLQVCLLLCDGLQD